MVGLLVLFGWWRDIHFFISLVRGYFAARHLKGLMGGWERLMFL